MATKTPQNLISTAVINGHTYTSQPMLNGQFHHAFTGRYEFTGGSVAGTLYVDTSDSAPELIRQDVGGDNVTDLAVWDQYKFLYDKAGTQSDAVTIAAASADKFFLANVFANGVRFRFVATGAGNWVQGGTSRRAV